MKTQKTILATLAIVMASTFSFGQSINNKSEVRVLPHHESGVLRLLYSGEEKETVTVKFYSGNALISKDKVKADKFEKGFIKLYDLRKLEAGDFKVEVETSGKSTGYAFTINEDKNIWVQYWNDYAIGQEVIASINPDKTLLVSGN